MTAMEQLRINPFSLSSCNTTWLCGPSLIELPGSCPVELLTRTSDLFPPRNAAPTAALKRNITKSILQMSLDHHIVTPFTAMLIENAEKDEIMLADQPKDPRKGCCPGQCLTLPITVSLMLCENSLCSELGTQGTRC